MTIRFKPNQTNNSLLKRQSLNRECEISKNRNKAVVDDRHSKQSNVVAKAIQEIVNSSNKTENADRMQDNIIASPVVTCTFLSR